VLAYGIPEALDLRAACVGEDGGSRRECWPVYQQRIRIGKLFDMEAPLPGSNLFSSAGVRQRRAMRPMTPRAQSL